MINMCGNSNKGISAIPFKLDIMNETTTHLTIVAVDAYPYILSTIKVHSNLKTFIC